MVACYHPLPDRHMLDAFTEKCAWCWEVREPGGYWPPTTAPRGQASSNALQPTPDS